MLEVAEGYEFDPDAKDPGSGQSVGVTKGGKELPYESDDRSKGDNDNWVTGYFEKVDAANRDFGDDPEVKRYVEVVRETERCVRWINMARREMEKKGDTAGAREANSVQDTIARREVAVLESLGLSEEKKRAANLISGLGS
ncbi:MAG: hypothetical protein ABII72_03850 [Parcubacteria group bacterium]